MDKPRILILDVEWKPTKAYVWQPWKENIMPEKIIEHGGLLCVSMKFLGKKEVLCFSEWTHGHKGMLEAAHDLMSSADAVVTYNGDKYDLPKLNGEFLLHGLPPIAPQTSIDCLKAVKKFGFFMNRLGFVAPFLGLGGKLEHEGMGLWIKVMDGDRKAQRRMEKYCNQDVKLLEKLYLRIRPFINNHPALRPLGTTVCPKCQSKKTQKRGFRTTACYQIQRYQCQSCTGWFTGTKKKVA